MVLLIRIEFIGCACKLFIVSKKRCLPSYSCIYHLLISIWWPAAGSINISNILTGKCLAKIKVSNSSPLDDCCCSSSCGGRSCNSQKRVQAAKVRSTVAEALEDITALFYDEERNEIYTGNRLGLVHVWSN